MFLRRTETKLWTLKYGSKHIQTSLILRQRPPKPYKLLRFFMISVRLFKMGKQSDFHLSFFQIVGAWRDFTLFKTGKQSDFHFSFFQIVGAWRDFTVVTKLIKNLKSLYGFGGRCLKIRDVCGMDFELCFKVHNLVSVHHIVPVHNILQKKRQIYSATFFWTCIQMTPAIWKIAQHTLYSFPEFLKIVPNPSGWYLNIYASFLRWLQTVSSP